MAIPLNSTTITVSRVFPDPAAGDWVDGYEANPPAAREVETGVRAVLPPPSASARIVGGDKIVYNAQMQCDPCDLQKEDTVTDEKSGIVWRVLWVTPVKGFFGFDHLTAGVRVVEGAAP